MLKAFRNLMSVILIVSLQAMPLPTYASKDDGDGFVPDDPSPISWNPPKEAHRKTEGKSALAGVNGKTGTPRRYASLETSHFAVAGKQYMLLKRRAPNGRILETNLVGEDRTEIARDPRGRGFMDSWEMVMPGRRVYMHEPRNGHFDIMEIEEVTPKVVYTAKFSRTRAGRYRLFNIRPRPLVPQNSVVQSKIVVGCQVAEPRLQELAGQVNDIVQDQQKSGLEKVLDDPKGLVDYSCRSGAFQKQFNDVKKGILEVFYSDPSWSKVGAQRAMKTNSQQSVSSQGRYLQCLRYHKLDTHASRIESALATYFNLGNEKFNWKIRCEAKSTVSDRANLWGQYINPVGSAPIINLVSRIDPSTGLAVDRKSPDPSFAQTFFHEMLHYSLIPDGDMQKAIDACCTQPEPSDPNKKECKDLDRLAKEIENKQAVNNQARANLKDDETGTYAKWQQHVREVYGDSQLGDNALDDFETKVGQVYSRLQEQGCKFASAKEMTSDCLEKLQAGIKDVIKKSFTGVKDSKFLQTYATYIYNNGSKSQEINKACPAKTAWKFWDLKQTPIERLQGVLGWFLPSVNAEVSFDECDIARAMGNGGSANPYVLGPVSGSIPENDWDRSMTSPAGNIETFSTMPSEGKKESADGSSSGRQTWGAPVSDSGSKRYPQQASDGPPRPHYESDGITDRQVKIRQAIEQYKKTDNEMNSFAKEVIKGTVISEAKADTGSSARAKSPRTSDDADVTQDTGAKSSRSRESRADTGGKLLSYNVSVQAKELSDPLANLASVTGAGINVASGESNDQASGAKPVRLPAITGSARGPASIGGTGGGDRDGDRDNGGGRAGSAANGPSGERGKSSGAHAHAGSLPAAENSPSQDSPPKARNKEEQNPDSDKIVQGKSDERAARALMTHLQDKRYFERVKPDLGRPSFQKSMIRHRIQIKDDLGKRHGASSPLQDRVLEFCKSEARLKKPEQCKK